MNISLGLPLSARTVVITRSQEQQGEATALFKAQGAKVLDLPALVIGPPDTWHPLDQSLTELAVFDWLIFSSSNGVNALEERLNRLGDTLANRANNVKVAAVGQKTAFTLEKLGVIANFVPPNFVADSLIQHFPDSPRGLKILIPRVQTGGRPVLSEAFRKAGALVVEVAAYESSCPEVIPEVTASAFLNNEVDAIAFTSGKTAMHTAQLFSKRFGEDWKLYLKHVNLISIGPQTSKTCKKYFSRVDQEADPHDLNGLIVACIHSFS